MEAATRTRMSLAAVGLALIVHLLLPGCAPHRRGRLPARDEAAASPARERVFTRPPAEEEIPRERPEIDRSQSPADQVCDMARSFLGTPYVYGGTTPRGFDCSGLVQYVYREVGVDLPRVSRHQARSGRAADLGALERGDLVFFRIDRNVISHVGIYVGGGEFVHAPGTGKYVRTDRIDNPWWRKRVKAVRRVLAG